MKDYFFNINEDYEGERVDKFLSLLIPECSRTFIQKILKEGNVKVNSKEIKASYKLLNNDNVTITIPDLILPEIKAQNIPLNIVYENSDYLIINKPKNMVVHPAAGHYTDTLVNAIMFYSKDLSGINGVLRPGIVHRIDKDTTGLLIICKNDRAHNSIAEQLKKHNIERTYHAICCGNLQDNKGTIDLPIGRSSKDRKKMAIDTNGKNAITHYEVLERFGKYSYIKCNLETGRTHQIRLHMSTIGHPLLGDEIYGSKSNEFKCFGQTLHAKTIGFNDPATNEFVLYDSDLPDYFIEILNKLRNKYL